MKTSRLHTSTLSDVSQAWLRMARRWLDPLLRPMPSRAATGLADAPMYGDPGQARDEFTRHAGLTFDAPELNRRLLLLAGLAASGRAGSGHVVIDVGGSTGFHRDQIAAVLSPGVPLDWIIIETDAYCEAAANRARPGIVYFNSMTRALGQGIRPTCIYSNSALQYIDDPLAALSEFAASGARAIVLERTPFRTGDITAHALQTLPRGNADRRVAALTLVSSGRVTQCLQEHGFQVALYRTDRAAFRLGGEIIDLYSLLAVRSATGSTI